MDSDIVGSILLQVVLIAVNAVFACAEIAVVSCNDAKLEKMAQEGNKKSGEAVSSDGTAIPFPCNDTGGHHSVRIFSEVPLQQKIFRIRIVSALVDAGMKIPEKTLDAIAVVLITLLLSYITLIFGELVPKSDLQCRRLSRLRSGFPVL